MTAKTGPIALEFAGFWRRFGAFAIDAVSLLVITAAVVPWEQQPHSGGASLSLPSPDNPASLGVLFAFSLAYFVASWSWHGQTPGMMALSIRVIRPDATAVAFSTALVRYLAGVLCLVPIGLGFIWIAFDRHKQGWHDKLADTVVIKVPRPPPVRAQATPSG